MSSRQFFCRSLIFFFLALIPQLVAAEPEAFDRQVLLLELETPLEVALVEVQNGGVLTLMHDSGKAYKVNIRLSDTGSSREVITSILEQHGPEFLQGQPHVEIVPADAGDDRIAIATLDGGALTLFLRLGKDGGSDSPDRPEAGLNGDIDRCCVQCGPFTVCACSVSLSCGSCCVAVCC